MSDNKKRKKSDQQTINRLKKVLNKTEIGREALQFVKDNKIKIIMDHQTDLSGYYTPGSNSVCINPNKDFHFQISILMHEIRHAWQDKNGLFIGLKNFDIENHILFRRFLEADCYSHQALHALQLREAGMIKPLISQVDSNLTVTKEVAQNKISTDNSEILINGFNAWFTSDDEIRFYDDYYMDIFIKGLEKGINEGSINLEKSNTEIKDKEGSSRNKENLYKYISKLGESFAKVNYIKKHTQEILNNPRCQNIFLDSSKEKLNYIKELKKLYY